MDLSILDKIKEITFFPHSWPAIFFQPPAKMIILQAEIQWLRLIQTLSKFSEILILINTLILQ